MDKLQEPLEAIRDIRNMMERSSRFRSLSGLAGVMVGLLAIIGTAAAYLYLGVSPLQKDHYRWALGPESATGSPFQLFLLADFGAVLLLSLLTGILMSNRNARKQGLPIWNATAKRLLVNMAIPLVAGGIYCGILIGQGQLILAVPATLIFYGMALLNASKYSIDDIRYLGIAEIAAGLLASWFADFGLLFWAFGFGILHIVYGIMIYHKYEK